MGEAILLMGPSQISQRCCARKCHLTISDFGFPISDFSLTPEIGLKVFPKSSYRSCRRIGNHRSTRRVLFRVWPADGTPRESLHKTQLAPVPCGRVCAAISFASALSLHRR